MEEAAFQDAAPAYSVPSKRSPKRFIYLIVAIVILILLFVLGFRIFGSSKQASKPSITPTVTVAPTDSPTPSISGEVSPTESPTPSAKPTTSPIDKATGLNRSKLTILVENGSGVAGAAGKVADDLKALGYTISSTGNADNFDFSGVTIELKTGSSDYLPLLKSDLSDKYTITASSSDLSATISADALVIVGK